jgi:hypothetical protein
VVANPWWFPRLAPRRALVGLPTHWRLTSAAAEMTGVRGAMSIAWNTVETVLEKDGLLILITKAPRRLIAFPLRQLETDDVAAIRHWVEAAEPRAAEPRAAETARPGAGIIVTAAPLTRSQALTVARAANRRQPILAGFVALLAAVVIMLSLLTNLSLGVVLAAFALLIWSMARRLTKLQPFVGTWAFTPSGVNSPNPLGAAFTPWDQITFVMVRRDVLLLRLGYAKAFLSMPTTELSGNDLEQILSWATAAQVRTR